ncbi:MAG: 4-hydroxythreonine-4-phosphate dehydrogenase PdxA [Nitrososphaerota archaeon]
MKNDKPFIGITMGDPAGSGPELAIKAIKKLKKDKDIEYYAKLLLIGDFKVFKKALEIVGSNNLKLIRINHPRDFIDDINTINIIDLNNVDINKLAYGKPSSMGGKAAYESIIKAVEYAIGKFIHAIVTMPISKESLNMAGYDYPGHTEILADLTKTKDVRMMLIAKNLRVVHVTTHVSLKKAIELIKKDRVVKTIEIANSYLENYFDIIKPKIAIAGLNPHASESGLFGDEEEKEIIPAIKEANKKGINASGPFPPDSVFYRAYNNEFDAVIAMYHDQGHIPIKMIGFMEGVNITLGLPIIRVSPDHGTVWGKAGKGTADESATLNAVKIAIKIALKKI